MAGGSSSTQHAIQILEQSSVSPPKGSVPDTSFPLTFFDVLWLYGGPVERIFFYPFPHSTSHFVEHLLPGLKSSLSLTLQHFYPLAGHTRLSPGSDDRYEIYYTDGDSVPFTLAECNADFNHLSGDHARDLAALRPLSPHLPGSDADAKPLLALQLTVFPNNGIAVGITVHHVACDGSTSMHFVKSWAAACRSSSPVSPHPVHDRSLITDPKGLYSIWLNEIRRLRAESLETSFMVEAKGDAELLSTFTLKREHIEALKRRVTAEKPQFHCSTFVVASAFVWVSLARARREFHAVNNIVHFACVVDCRARLQPPVPQAYFGNCLGLCMTTEKARELCGEDGVAVASEAIGRAVEGLGRGALNEAEGWLQRLMEAIVNKPMSIAGSPKLRVYDTDFGFGKPAKVEVISIVHNGAVSLAESKDGEGGGIEIGVALAKGEMDEFLSHFSNNLKALEVEGA